MGKAHADVRRDRRAGARAASLAELAPVDALLRRARAALRYIFG
jgi:hypothetical protein